MAKVSFGVKIGVSDGDFAAFSTSARVAEQYGFEAFWVGESARGNDPYGLLAHVASITSLRVGIAVALMPLHDPADIARSAATLDQLSGGRFTLATGVGGERAADFSIHGLDRATRGRRLDEQMEIIRALWSGEEVHHEGKYYQVDGKLDVLPKQDPLPVYVGGRGGVSPIQRRVYERVVKTAQGWMPYVMSPETYARGQKSIADVGGGPDTIWSFVAHANVAASGDGKIEWDYAARQQAGRGRNGEGPSPEQIARAESFIIAGTPDQAIARLNQYVDLGVSDICFNWACPPGEGDNQMKILAEQVLPAVRAHAASRG